MTLLESDEAEGLSTEALSVAKALVLESMRKVTLAAGVLDVAHSNEELPTLVKIDVVLKIDAMFGFEEEVTDVDTRIPVDDIATRVVAGIGKHVELPAAEEFPAPHGVHELISNRA